MAVWSRDSQLRQLLPGATFAVRRNFSGSSSTPPACAATVKGTGMATAMLIVEYANLCWDETLADLEKQSRHMTGRISASDTLTMHFDVPCSEFNLTLVAGGPCEKFVVKIYTADLHAASWIIRPRETLETFSP